MMLFKKKKNMKSNLIVTKNSIQETEKQKTWVLHLVYGTSTIFLCSSTFLAVEL